MYIVYILYLDSIDSRVEHSVLSCCCMSGDFDLVDSCATHLPPSLSYVSLTHSRSPAAGGGD